MTALKSVTCPSCGGDIEVASLATCAATCPYCENRVIINEAAILAKGKMSLLAETPSCLAVGWPAECMGREIEVLGRIQYRYDSGIWDEWWIQFRDDESYSWISQDEGRYMLEKPTDIRIDADKFKQLAPGTPVTLGGHEFFVQEIGAAAMVGMQGQLPFPVDADEVMNFIDLTDNKNKVTVELFNDGSQEVFVGRYLSPKKLRSFQDDEVQATSPLIKLYGAPEFHNPDHPVISASEGVNLQSVSCPNCGGSVETSGDPNKSMIVCSYCRAGLDVTVPGTANLLFQAQKHGIDLPVGLGDVCHLRGEDYRVAGRILYHQREDGISYYWTSCQLLNLGKGDNAFLEFENGHWCLFKPLKKPVKVQPHTLNRGQSVSHLGDSFHVFERGYCSIARIDGELTWVARIGDNSQFMDAVKPPLMLSAEWTAREMEWSMGSYLTPGEVAAAFKKDLATFAAPEGVHPAQPFDASPNQRWSAQFACAIAGLMLVLFFWAMVGQGTPVLSDQTVTSAQYLSDTGYISPEFEIPQGTHICKFEAHSGRLSNQWIGFSIAFIDKEDKVLVDADGVVEYYSGVEGGESWSEGSRNTYQLVKLKGPAKYRVNIFGDTGRWSRAGGDSVSTSGPNLTISVRRGVRVARYYMYGLLLALIYPTARLVKWIFFKSTKWSDDDDD